MIVNPFSYLIEKLKGKVDKSGDTMSGNLTVDRRNGTAGTEGYSGIILGNNVPYSQNENSTGYARFFTKNGHSIDVYAKHEPNNNQEIILPESDGTLALKSDIFDSANPFAFRGRMGYDVASTDFNDYRTGTYRNDGTNLFPYSNAPSSSADNGWLICFTDSDFYYQFWISTYLGSCKWRKRSSGSWGSWTAWNF